MKPLQLQQELEKQKKINEKTENRNRVRTDIAISNLNKYGFGGAELKSKK